LAVYPGTFDPFTPGHHDLVARARMMFDRIIVLLAVNPDKRPTAQATARAARVRDAIPAAWGNVEVGTWTGLTTAYCVRRLPPSRSSPRSDCPQLHGPGYGQDRGGGSLTPTRTTSALGIQTVWLPSRPQLAATSSTVARAYRSTQSARPSLNSEE
jgi:pantetheine-phosphate adenylyltransferase